MCPYTDRLIKLFENNDSDACLVIGPPGVGKTTLLEKLTTKFEDKNYLYHLLGTTGAAARITTKKTGKDACTIHQKIYRFNTLLSSEGESVFDIIDNESDIFQIIIVDEASMVGNKYHPDSSLTYGSGRLLNDLIKSFSVSSSGKTKLILVGDKFQLAPVYEEFCPALSKSYLEEMFNLRVEEIRLTKNYRQEEAPEILEFAKQFLR